MVPLKGFDEEPFDNEEHVRALRDGVTVSMVCSWSSGRRYWKTHNVPRHEENLEHLLLRQEDQADQRQNLREGPDGVAAADARSGSKGVKKKGASIRLTCPERLEVNTMASASLRRDLSEHSLPLPALAPPTKRRSATHCRSCSPSIRTKGTEERGRYPSLSQRVGVSTPPRARRSEGGAHPLTCNR